MRDLSGKNNPAYKHGAVHTKLYNVWKAIKSRCNNPNNVAYKNYGGRGIKCEFRDFNHFRNYILSTIGTRPKDHSIDRIDNDGNYVEGNLRWATKSQQAFNRRKRIHASSKYKGVSFCNTTKKWSVCLTASGFNTEEEARKFIGDFYERQ